jgi:tRNA-splicing ligase RtcB
MSRIQAKRKARGRDLFAGLGTMGVTVRAQSRAGVAEEMPESCKDVAEVVEVLEAARVTQRVARLKPFAVIKGDTGIRLFPRSASAHDMEIP